MKIFGKTLPEAAAELGLDPQYMRICAQEDIEKPVKRFSFIVCRKGRKKYSYKIHEPLYQLFKEGLKC